jgi:hypothetical protein
MTSATPFGYWPTAIMFPLASVSVSPPAPAGSA